jgi:hypothetical protein
MVKVIRTSTTKGGDIVDRAFTVNKQKVLSALYWLKNTIMSTGISQSRQADLIG